ncbi:MAG: serpin family protein [Sandaracinus sp.]
MTPRSRLSALVLALATACGGAHAAPAVTPVQVNAVDARSFADASNATGLDVYRQLAATGTDNLAISPASISTALTMTYGGARGDTAAVMARGLHLASSPEDATRLAGAAVQTFNDPSRTAYELAVANRLFGDRSYPFAPAFVQRTGEAFGAELEVVDFAGASEAARTTINHWVSDRTHERIDELLPAGSVTGDTRLVLVNAVYFHGRWAEPFDPSATFDAPFHTANGELSARTMHRVGGRYGEDHVDGGDVQLYALPYAASEDGHDAMSMLFVLPRNAGDLPAIEQGLDAATVARWASAVYERRDVEVAIPRFRMELDAFSLRPALTAMGMGPIFEGGADFSGMDAAGERRLWVSDVFHQVFVELNEEGTEAAAATGVVMVEESAEISEPPRFTADHPFLFFLRDDTTGAILFAGRLARPA